MDQRFDNRHQDASPGSDMVGELESARAVRRSASGQMSVSIADVSKTQSFKRDLKTLGRIRELAKTTTAGR
jgi:hypothetical protein